ncbi:MAG: TraR/DksA C4-type zinc finger protein [Nocardioides marinisabuli]|uniref:TraR/DksA family transcriptional regulator n=1 Tax=Nocardioides marinisabuli TaxID=419476 RepID=UPI00321B2744
MARGTRALAGQAVTAARRALGLQPGDTGDDPTPVEQPAPATRSTSATKRTAAKKSAPAAKKTAAKKTPAKKTAAKKTPAKKTAATKTQQPRTTTPTAPEKKAAPVTTSPAKKTATKKAAPKKSAAKAPADSLVVKADEEAWTPAELDELMAELHEQRDHSATVVEEMEAELDGLMRDSGDGAGQDQADVGATSFERDHEMSVLNSERDKLAQIDRALARIADGSYGQCESCSQPIGKLRLMAFPRATLCMPCKQREERR